jgi:hypothetical protein
MRTRLLAMRNEDYDRELLAIVTSFCVLVAAAVSVFDISSSMTKSAAAASSTVEQPAATAVRVVGTPFVPNTNPSQR